MFITMLTSKSHRASSLVLRLVLHLALLALWDNCLGAICRAETTALWLFDEPRALYPSSVLDSSSKNDYPLVIGQGGRLVAGKYGNALETTKRRLEEYPWGPAVFGLERPWTRSLRDPGAMTWADSNFAALMTHGEKHLRKEVGFVNATDTDLNLGQFDWTVEFWYLPAKEAATDGVVFEIGMGPLGKDSSLTRLTLAADGRHFQLRNDPNAELLNIPTDVRSLRAESGQWHHLAFTFSASESQLRHYVDGKLQPLPSKCALQQLPHGDEAYFTLARDGKWEQPLRGAIDELRFSTGLVYTDSFEVPGSFAEEYPATKLAKGPPLLFDGSLQKDAPIPLGTRKHVFIDEALIADLGGCQLQVNPPRRAERVLGDLQGAFRKHLTVVEDETGVIRIYNSLEEDWLGVFRSVDGIRFDIPDLKIPKPLRKSSDKKKRSQNSPNIVIPEMVGGLGNPFLDPNGPREERWKYFSDYHRRGIYLYTSPDGYQWEREKVATLPFRSGTQSCTFYDDQRQRYVSYHRSGIFHTPAGDTQRSSVVTEHQDLHKPLDFEPLSQEQYLELAENNSLRSPLPWYLDNGPLTPGGFGMEFPHAFDPIPEDPPGTDIYITKAQKYPWAPDTYVAFPIVYFHYVPDGPLTRNLLGMPHRGRGSGPLETQLCVSRDGLNWTRLPRPAYVGIGMHEGRDVVTAYLAHGMVRRGKEIWQYYFGETDYHSTYMKNKAGRGVYRVVQRLDGFVSIDSPYGKDSVVTTKPLVFDGEYLTLNVDTEATGYVQVGILDENGKPIEGYSPDDCIYINGDFIDTRVEWLGKGSDVSQLAGKTVQLVFRMRGSKLYAMQFVDQ